MLHNSSISVPSRCRHVHALHPVAPLKLKACSMPGRERTLPATAMLSLLPSTSHTSQNITLKLKA